MPRISGQLSFAPGAASMVFGVTPTIPTGSSSSSVAPPTSGPDFAGKMDWSAIPGAWWPEIARDISGDAKSPYSDAMIAAFGAATLSIDWQGTGPYGMPYNVAAHARATVPLTVSPSDHLQTGQVNPIAVPFAPGDAEENWASTHSVPPTSSDFAPSTDYHRLVARLNAAGTGFDRIYEGYQVHSEDGGSSYGASGLNVLDLTTGDPPRENDPLPTAGGLPITPLNVNYAAALLASRGGAAIGLPTRITLPNGNISNCFVWPARNTDLNGQPPRDSSNAPIRAPLPLGARLRITASAYSALAAVYGPGGSSPDAVVFAVFAGWRTRGLIVDDISGAGVEVEGYPDPRWTSGQLVALSLPLSDFEVVATVKSPITFTGPSSGASGVAASPFTLTYTVSGNTNFATSAYFYWSTDGGTTLSTINDPAFSPGSVVFQDGAIGPFTMTFTPPGVGSYTLLALYGGQANYPIDNPAFTAT